LNEQVRRNSARFEGYAFQLTVEEFAILRSQIATSSGTHGGRRYPPWVFTEHGVVMAATVLNSDTAVAAMKLVVEVFVQERRRRRGSNLVTTTFADLAVTEGGGLVPRLQQALEALLDTVVDQRSQTTVLTVGR
jgi:ORF6N domain